MSNPSEWMQIHFNDVNRNELPPPPTTTAAATRNNNSSLDQGRVARPIRRRSRASRRTPTTLLNTDTTNFRAMVQQFTGSPNITTTYAARPSNATGLYDFMQHAASAAASAPPASGFQMQYPNQIQQQHMLMIDNMLGHGGISSHAPPEASSASEDREYDNYMF
ncbi:hypothetical protein ACS0TY_017931 [Phlomoides rotata]